MCTVADRRCESERRILMALPSDLPKPVISNENSDFFGRPGAWLSWWGECGMRGSEILSALEARGFEPIPATLCRWNKYWPEAEPGVAESIPDRKGPDYLLTRRWPIAPVWIMAWRFGGPEACAYYKFRYDGHEYVFKVIVPAPRVVYLDLGSAKALVRYPETWRMISLEDQPVAEFSVRSFVSKWALPPVALYWEPYTSQEAFPLSPSQFLAALEQAGREAKQYAIKYQYSEVF